MATGWGAIDDAATVKAKVLMEIEVDLLQDKDCRDSSDLVVCARSKKTSGDPTCSGDSGGPLVCQRTFDGRWELTGITSYGYGNQVEERMLYGNEIDAIGQVYNQISQETNPTKQAELMKIAGEILGEAGSLEELNYPEPDDSNFAASSYNYQYGDYYFNYGYNYDDSFYAYQNQVDYNPDFTEAEKLEASYVNMGLAQDTGSKLAKNSDRPKIRTYPCGGSTPGMFTRTVNYRTFIDDNDLFMSSFEPSQDLSLKGGIPSIDFMEQILNHQISQNLTFDNLATDLAVAQKQVNLYTILENHGCYCVHIFDQNKRWPIGGMPVDNLDKICQLWWMCRRCGVINNKCGDNKNIHPYVAKVQMSTGNILNCSPTGDINPIDAECGLQHCECDKQLVQNLKELILL